MRKILFATLILFIAQDKIPISNAQQHATRPSSSGNLATQAATFRDAATIFSGSVGISEPRAYVDVTAYGAKGDGTTDDSAAIKAAITAACTAHTLVNGTFPVHPDVFFPPGIYRWNRSSSNTPEFTIPCSFIRLYGAGNSLGPQFGQLSQVGLVPLNCPAGNSSPEFLVQQLGGVSFENMDINGCNEPLWVRSSVDVVLRNVGLGFASATGLADNTPLKVTNSFWFWWLGGETTAPSGSKLPVLFTNETPLGAEPAEDYLIDIENVTFGVSGIQISSRVNQTGGPESFKFINLGFEGISGDDVSITNQGAGIHVGALTFDNVQVQDNPSGTTPAVLGLNPQGGNFVNAGGITMNHVSGVSAAIKVHDSTHTELGEYNINGCPDCNAAVIDQNGKAIGNGTTSEWYGGVDHITNVAAPNFVPIALTTPFNIEIAAPADRWCPAGTTTCTEAMDATMGLLFGDGSISGFSSGFKSTAPNTLDVQFANLLPPSSVTGTATTGGSLAAASYYFAIWATTGTTVPQCAFAPTTLSTLTYGGPIVVSGTNHAIKFAWTDPPAPLSGSIQGYCIDVETAASGAGNIIGGGISNRFIYIAGSGVTTFSYTGQAQSTGYSIAPQSTMVYKHRLTPTSLGVGTLNPLFNADIRGSIAGATYNTQTNCSSSASPAACASASAGSVTVAASATTEVVNTTAITANSQVLLTFDSSLGTRLGVTCNTTAVQGTISARTAGSSFTIKLPTAPSTNPACFGYQIVN